MSSEIGPKNAVWDKIIVQEQTFQELQFLLKVYLEANVVLEV